MKKLLQLFLLLPFTCYVAHAQQQQLIVNKEIVMGGGTSVHPIYIVVGNPGANAVVSNNGGFIYSESEFNMLLWNIGTGIGTYVVPFGYSASYYLPVTMLISSPGAGPGVVKFSTYHGSNWNNSLYKPSDVTSMSDFLAPDYSANMVDRFWIMDANSGYATKPGINAIFTYIRNGANSEIAAPNRIVEKDLIAQRFNSGQNTWNDFYGATNMDVVAGNTGNVTSGAVAPAAFYRSWTLANDSTLLTSIPAINAATGFNVYPNPAGQLLNIQFAKGEEGDAVISIIDVIGREIIQKKLYISSGLILPIDISTLPAAMYFVRVSTNNSVETSRFIKK